MSRTYRRDRAPKSESLGFVLNRERADLMRRLRSAKDEEAMVVQRLALAKRQSDPEAIREAQTELHSARAEVEFIETQIASL